MNYNPPSDVIIYDTTLRDGEQTPGVTITTDEKITIAEKLDKLGVDVIELGFPAASPGEQETFKQVAKLGFTSKISGLARALKPDIDKAIDADADYVTLLTCTPYGINTHRLLVRGKRVEASTEKQLFINIHL